MSQEAKSTPTLAPVIQASELALHFLELLEDDQVLTKLRRALYPRELSDKLDSLQTTIISLTNQIQEKDVVIASMQAQITKLEDDLDAQQQYSRRPNLRIHGIPEPAGDSDENTDAIILDVVNNKIKLRPKISIDDIAASHRVGPKPQQAQSSVNTEEEGTHNPQRAARPLMVRFANVRVRNLVFRSRTNLKDRNATASNAIYVNEDLTQARARLLKDCRRLKKEKRINDCWSWNGNILIKDAVNKVILVRSYRDISVYR